MRTNLKGFAQCEAYIKGDDLTGYFTHKGVDMTDTEIRSMIQYGIAHDCECDSDIPDDIIDYIIKVNRYQGEKCEQLSLF